MRIRTRSRRNPKLRDLTPEQEAQMEQAALFKTRALIYQKGAAHILTEDNYLSKGELFEVATILQEASDLRLQADGIQSAIHKAEMEANPAPAPKRKPRAKQ